MYPIISIRDDASEAPEQVGTKYKFWYDDHQRMFKLGREGTGEHWAEKVACEVCALLGLPHASYDLARWRERLGVTTRNIVPTNGRLILGNELLPTFVGDYDGAQRYRARQHTVGRVIAAVDADIKSPMGTPVDFPLSEPKDFIAGYLLLDAWIGNTDRHHENWGLVLVQEQIYLAPTFDHASSLGRELTDEERIDRLKTRDKRRDISSYTARARSGFYRTESDNHPLTTLEAFREAGRRAPDGGRYWSGRLGEVTAAEIDDILGQIPVAAMSDPAREFARAVLLQNQKRICSNE